MKLLSRYGLILIILTGSGLTGSLSFAQEASKGLSIDQIIKPYHGGAIYLPAPLASPKAVAVETRPIEVKYKNGTVYLHREITRFSDSKLLSNGKYQEFFDNGQLFTEGTYDNGKRMGTWTYYHKNSTTCKSITYVAGNPEGTWKVFRKDKTLSAERTYAAGKRAGLWLVFDKTGKIKIREVPYKKGKEEGFVKSWFDTGKQQSLRSFSNGKMHGLHTYWNAEERKIAEVNYINGKQDGVSKKWITEKELVTQVFKKGKLISTKTTDL